jgi:uracil-DNA glycosylase family 4
MDVREQLRRYLEHRREMGESELVLDSLTIEEAMRIVTGARAKPPSRPAHDEGANTPDSSTPDWREILRAAGGEPAATGQPSRRPGTPGVGRDPHVSPPAQPRPSASPREIASRADTPRTGTARADHPVDAPIGLTVGTGARELFGGPLAHLGSLNALAQAIHDCTRCPLYATATQAVPGEGPPDADVMVVGEAPGASEDATGRPFVGAAGQLLTKILEAVDVRREDVFICNVMKHRPPGNRNPIPDEVAACGPYLVRQIELIQPKVILALGTFAAQTLLATKLPISKLRGQLHRYQGVPLIVTYHPAALLRNPGWKRPTWDDVKLARRVLDRARSA